MKIINKMLSAFTAAVMGTAACAGGIVGSLGTAAADMTAIDIVNDMGMGWNLGNTFDVWNGTAETGWGNLKTTQVMIDTVHSYGFNSVRIPVSWNQHVNSTTFDIDDDYLARIKEVIDYCYANDMYAIVDMHWDWVDPNSNTPLWLNGGMSAETQFKTMWTEIANYFKDYDNHLVFQSMNEVWWDSSSYSDNDYKTLNTLNQDFVDIFRASGGNNAERLLVLAGANADLSKTCNSKYVVPDDDMVAVDVHYYTPAEFCVRKQNDTWGTNKTTWGTDAEKSDVVNDFSKLTQSFVSKGVPVIVGEYGVLTNEGKEIESIREFNKTIAGTALSTDGISAFLWDDSDAGGHKYFSRKDLKFHDEEMGKIYIDLAGNGYVPPTIDWVEVEINDEGKFQIGSATKIKLEFECPIVDADHRIGSGGAISYWDNVSGGNVQNAISISVTSDETGAIVCSETDADGEVVQYGYINIPAGVSPANVYAQIYWAGYNEFNGSEYIGWNDIKDKTQFPTLVKAYVPGIVQGGDDPIYGDANDNGEVEVADAVFILQALADPSNEEFKRSAQGEINADCSSVGNGVDSEDALAILKYKATIIDKLPAA